MQLIALINVKMFGVRKWQRSTEPRRPPHPGGVFVSAGCSCAARQYHSPTWLDNAHRALDGAVTDAYGLGEDWAAGRLDEDESLARLFRPNQEHAAAEAAS